MDANAFTIRISRIWVHHFNFRLLIYLCFIYVRIYSVEVARVPLGHAVQLNCFPSNVPDVDLYIVQWKKQGSLSPVFLWRKGQISRVGRGYEGRVQLLDQAVLSIVDVKSTDEGFYDCQTWAVNGHPIGNASSSSLELFGGIPKWIRQPKSVVIAPGSLTEFYCDTDPPFAIIQWQQNGTTLINNSTYVTIVKNKLVIQVGHNRNEYQSQSGIYRCVVNWKNAALESVPANLSIASISPFHQHDQVNLTSQIRGNAVLQGFMPESLPTALPMVAHNGVPLAKFDDRKLLLPSGNLHIQNVALPDEGIYQFSALNFITGEIVKTNSVVLKVQALDANESPQLLAAQHDKNSLLVGDNTTLECACNGNPPPIISWSKYGGILPAGRHRQILGNLLLFDLRTNDTGTYVCEANNGVGFPVSTISTVDVIEEPKIVNWISEYEVNEGEELVLECITNSHVAIRWSHNGSNLNIENIIIKSNKLTITVAQRYHAGFYQCFAFNKAGVTMLTLRVRVISKMSTNEEALGSNPRREPPIRLVPDADWGQNRNFTGVESEYPDFTDKDWQDPKTLNKKRNKKKNKQKSGGTGDDKVLMVPPTKPEVTKLSDESVMVRWDVPPNSGLPIQFFRVQYRVVGKHKVWKTIDEDIPPHILSYEVPNLRTGQTYRFRIAAVYSNNDNKQGPNSFRFTLQKDPPMKKPAVVLTIDDIKAISPSAIAIRWRFLEIEEVPIDGFFIYYRATSSAGSYTKVTVLGANTPSHIISHLLPDTSYDIKMQSFNIAGTSDFSSIHTDKTFASVPQISEESEPKEDVLPPPNTAANNQLLFIILGIVLGILVLLLGLFVGYCLYKQRQRLTVSLNTNKDHNKENNESQEMGQYTAANTSSTIANGHNGLSTSIFLWHKNTNHVKHLQSNGDATIAVQELEGDEVVDQVEGKSSDSLESIENTSLNE